VQNHIFCIYHDISQADHVVDQLLAAGVGRKHISILTSEAGGARHLALRQGIKATESGGLGASVGGAIGLIAGTLITAATAGVGILAAGPLFAGLAGLGVGAAAGGLGGALIGAGIPEAEARFYAQEIAEKDAILVGVEIVESDRDIVRQIMSKRPVPSEADG
jgi:hypothetical protein